MAVFIYIQAVEVHETSSNQPAPGKAARLLTIERILSRPA